MKTLDGTYYYPNLLATFLNHSTVTDFAKFLG